MSLSTVSDRLPRMKRLIEATDVVCPAGCPAMSGFGVLCRLEGEVIDARASPQAVARYCLGDNRECPTWRADKEATWENRNLQKDMEREERSAPRRPQNPASYYGRSGQFFGEG